MLQSIPTRENINRDKFFLFTFENFGTEIQDIFWTDFCGITFERIYRGLQEDCAWHEMTGDGRKLFWKKKCLCFPLPS